MFNVCIIFSGVLTSFILSHILRGAFKILIPELLFILNISILSVAHISGYFGFYKLHYTTTVFIVCGIVLLHSILIISEHLSVKYSHHTFNLKQSKKINNIDFILVLFLIVYFFVTMASKLDGHSVMFLFSDVIRDDFGNAYVVYFSIFFTTYFIVNSQSVFEYLVSLLLLFILFLMGIKGIVLLPIFAFAVRYCLYNKAISLNRIVCFIFVGIILFVVSYILPFMLIEKLEFADSLNIIVLKFFKYVSAGILGFDYDLNSSVEFALNIDSIFLPFYNFLVSDSKASYMVNSLSPIIYNSTDIGSNVKTFWGTIYLNSGYYFVFVYLFYYLVLGFFYFILILNFSNLRYTNSALIMFLCAMFYAWFEYYYWHAFFFYGIIYGLLLDFFSLFISKLNLRLFYGQNTSVR